MKNFDPVTLPAPETRSETKDFASTTVHGQVLALRLRYSRSGDLLLAIKSTRSDLLTRWSAGGPCGPASLPVPKSGDQTITLSPSMPPLVVSGELATRIAVLTTLAKPLEGDAWTEHHWAQLAMRDYPMFKAASDWAIEHYSDVSPEPVLF